MTPYDSTPLDGLLDKLHRGDEAAVAEAFRIHETALRHLIRRSMPNRLRPWFDSTDVLQNVWAEVVEGLRRQDWRFESPAQFKAFLVQVAKNRLVDRVRRHRNDRLHQRSLETIPPARLTRDDSSEVGAQAQANELWERLVESCPSKHRDILHLKRRGLTLAEIAAETGLHASSIRRILYDLARRVATHAE